MKADRQSPLRLPGALADLPLRPAQEKILAYRHGRMGIAAVPGSGKTWTLSLMAASLVAGNRLHEDQEVLVVTLVNSAVDNFYQRVSLFVQSTGLLPNQGYRVRTLHGLAHDIVRQRPALCGLENEFQIIDERQAEAIRDEVSRAWLAANPQGLEQYLIGGKDASYYAWLRSEQLPDLVKALALSFIRTAKDRQLTPELLRHRLDELPMPLPLAEMGWQLYHDYQRALVYRGAVDFDDLIRLALQAMKSDPDYLARLQYQWPFILEDEAQDSSELQEQILHTLAGPKGNWVRVGDPNQAIFETFTTASPQFLRDFMRQKNVQPRDLPESGRSTASIIWLANALVDWTMREHPMLEARQDALEKPPEIQPAGPGDPQPNPVDDPAGIHLVAKRYTSQQEIQAVADSIAHWLPDHSDWTIAALSAKNEHGFALADELRKRKLPYDDSLLRSSTSTRQSAGALTNLLRCLADPKSSSKLSTAYQVWRRADRNDEDARPRLEQAAELLKKLPQVEDYLYPSPGNDWLEAQASAGLDGSVVEQLGQFRQLVQRWQAAILLPVDQVLLTLAQDVLSEPAELAMAHKLAGLLRRAGQANPEWRMLELAAELGVIAKNERRFLGFSQDDTGFDPDRYRGKVVVATIHKAKGMEWDRVYFLSANNYDFPAGLPGDRFLSEKPYLRDNLNLEAEAMEQITFLEGKDPYDWYQEGVASQRARQEYVRERLRLFYVAVTRAKKELVITWNTGRSGRQQPALALVALKAAWDRHTSAADHHGEDE